MGILNVTPDSFSDGGVFFSPKQAVAHGIRMVEEGADLIDVGGESTRPGAKAVSAKDEIARVVPVIKQLSQKVQVPISIDTAKAAVAEAAIEAGAAVVNDVSALGDPKMAGIVAQAQLPIVLMHMRGNPRTMQKQTQYKSLVRDILKELKQRIQLALAAGIEKKQIIIDPGIGFGKTLEQNLKLMAHLDAFVELGYPVLLGTSRKSLIGGVLDVPVEERIWGTAATVALGAAAGVKILRVHDVKAMKQVAHMATAIAKSY